LVISTFSAILKLQVGFERRRCRVRFPLAPRRRIGS
jgi:hypothetical protein